MKSKQVQEFKETKIGKIPADWDVTRLENVCTLFVPMRNKPNEFVGNIPWLRIEDLDGKFVSDSKSGQYVTPEIINEMNLRLFPIGTVLCSCTATIGICAITQKELVTNQQFIGIYPTGINNEFLYYYLLTQKNNLSNIAFGTVGGYITRKRFEDFQIILPPINEQKSIVKTLSHLDTKIENLQDQNKILEQTAQAIFKSWFVDFDGQTEFGDSELGHIPKGWSVEKLQELCTSIQNGGTPKRMEPTFWDNGTINWYKTGELQDNFLLDSEEKITEMGLEKSSTHLWPQNTILFAIYAFPVVGRMGILTKPGCSNQAASGLIPKDEIGTNFLFLSLIFSRNFLGRIATGTAQQNISQDILKNHTIILPPITLISKFNKKIEPIFEQIKINQIQIQLLTKTRDALLPKLMSGEIRV